MDYYNFFLPTWAHSAIMMGLFLLFVFVLYRVLKRKDISGNVKFLLILILFLLPVVGGLIALYYPVPKEFRHQKEFN